MKTKKRIQTASPITPSHGALSETPLNAYRFLKGAADSAIAKQLASVGYGKAPHLEGWTLFFEVSNARFDSAPASPENVATKAIADIKAWNVQGFRRTRAVLDRKAPDVSKFVFAAIDATNNGPVYELATYLDRIQDLATAPERKATRKQDHAALEALAARGLNDVLFKALRSMLSDAQVQEPVIETAPAIDHTAATTELYLWLRDWRETARAVIKNKSHLRMLGIGNKTKKTSTTTTPIAPSAPSAPTTPALPPVSITPVAQLPQGTSANDATKVA